MSESNELPIQIDVSSVSEMLQRGDDFLLLDVREENEYAVAKITGSTLIPMSEIGSRVQELDEHKDRLIVVHCHHGGRSLQVTQGLRGRGFTKVQNMDGGIDLWSQTVDPTVDRY
ncbi:putative adenylyltransferase/sulfurtransferase MoeZ [Novipirellula galeiformis]|uniref:Putative adenylyltransferase/sulfurtransferase MoeZ n=1 Tax=Novipirellula galeiformis TaxID=2528004 RepID=A0A5C6C7S7_9BACT|nr:rhodanese-like domain-containing protein [Novipirellula galeiformis]TWU20145.1 putative adenylyltransferase/sulfurtransferase MoeZ [Novipirellula galeiformis]